VALRRKQARKTRAKKGGGIAKAIARGRAARKAAKRASVQKSEARNQARTRRLAPLEIVSAPHSRVAAQLGDEAVVATYNVHRWTGANGRSVPDPARAGFVISEIDADVIALQEVLRPYDGEDPLSSLSSALGYHYVFATTRVHKRGEQGNAILSRVPIQSCSVLDISHSRIEKRGVLAAQFGDFDRGLSVIATHLSLVDRTRGRQVESLLQHPELNAGPSVLLGDMNAWRKCKATRTLDDEFSRHHNRKWPASFPARRPVLALDRIYSMNAEIKEVFSHNTEASRRASDHLPVVARVRLPGR
jgi:endonuclease/exonuclease/phosphatase family metal-dependent hydrolase